MNQQRVIVAAVLALESGSVDEEAGGDARRWDNQQL
jgi:hypothetical protein